MFLLKVLLTTNVYATDGVQQNRSIQLCDTGRTIGTLITEQVKVDRVTGEIHLNANVIKEHMMPLNGQQKLSNEQEQKTISKQDQELSAEADKSLSTEQMPRSTEKEKSLSYKELNFLSNYESLP